MFSMLCFVICVFVLVELFYTEWTPIRHYVEEQDRYFSGNRRIIYQSTPPARQKPTKAPATRPFISKILDDTSHGIRGVFVERFVTSRQSNVLKIGIGCAITTRRSKNLSPHYIGQTAPLIRTMLSSFCKTASLNHDYHFYLTYDYDDRFFLQPHATDAFITTFIQTAKKLCPKAIVPELHLFYVAYSSKPAWAQNDAMMQAYLDGADYMFRVNDDVQLMNRNWTAEFILALQNSDPENVGVVGPKHLGGNEALITLDFVHRTHIDIFGFFYPREFLDWYADDWITAVYQPRAYKSDTHKAIHTYELGTRYNHTEIREPDLVMKTIDREKIVINRLVNY